MQGAVWEGRFKSRSLLDEKALLACMAYIDLNPNRAGLSETLEGSDYTSIQARIEAYIQDRSGGLKTDKTPSDPLESAPAVSTESGSEQDQPESKLPAAPLFEFTGATGDTKLSLPFHFYDFLDLVEWTGRAIRADKPLCPRTPVWNNSGLWPRSPT